jgi:hypothetical protein
VPIRTTEVSRRHSSMPEHVLDFDFIVTGDFRYPGGTSAAIAEEIRVLKHSGWSWRLNQFDSKVFRDRPLNGRILSLARSGDFLSSGETARCGTWFVHNPHCLLWGVPETSFRPRRIVIVAHQAPVSFFGNFYYDPWKIDDSFRRSWPDAEVIWAPISPLCRGMFEKIGFDRDLLGFDWFNIFTGPFSSPRRPVTLPMRIGCHGRPEPSKWPADRKTALQVYPDDPEFDVTLLGPDPVTSGPIAPFPHRWRTFRFNEIDVDDFLAMIDFFVYRPHPDLVEAFGRTSAEAMLNGKLAVLPRSLEPTFGSLAVYAEPHEVAGVVRRFARAPDEYLQFVRRSASEAAALYGPQGLVARLERLRGDDGQGLLAAPLGRPSARTAARRQLRIAAAKAALKPIVKRFLRLAGIHRPSANAPGGARGGRVRCYL